MRRDARAQELNVDQFVALQWELHRLQAGVGASTQEQDGQTRLAAPRDDLM